MSETAEFEVVKEIEGVGYGEGRTCTAPAPQKWGAVGVADPASRSDAPGL